MTPSTARSSSTATTSAHSASLTSATPSVLFQDYTYFPLSIRDNIALGDPEYFHNEAHVNMAAWLGGTSESIAELSEEYGTYLDKLVRDYFSSMPEGTKDAVWENGLFCGAMGRGMGSHAKGPGMSRGQMHGLAQRVRPVHDGVGGRVPSLRLDTSMKATFN
ncbi:hypothetical protein DICSQDRAFT_175571 [Dichomitus squalens LYAD-421 SS1]|nr:uncharacterized protein DICSQDRAFT_175571 [Dichomitus squalens LYAD-421 SS1]EJF55743.1 hypothetical protein DICSQDRAFT_175571 [Dichomitus squalens LYAD-421 SS1]